MEGYDIVMPKLYLIPNTIAEETTGILASYGLDAIKNVRIFFVEEPKSARQLIKTLFTDFPLQSCEWLPLNEHSKNVDIQEYGKRLLDNDCAIISEAGCPGVADPGQDLVKIAHEQNIEIIPLIGPSSILLALMSSGLNGQNFAFNGYMPKDSRDRKQKIKSLEIRSTTEGQTQIFMDTPYRNQNLFEDILFTCNDRTLLCVACDITGTQQFIKTKPISQWKKTKVDLNKKSALFLIYSSENLQLLSPNFSKSIKQARKEIKEGKTYSMKEVFGD